MGQRGRPFPDYVTTRSAVAPTSGQVFLSVDGDDAQQFTYAQFVAFIAANSGGGGGGGNIDGGTPSTV